MLLSFVSTCSDVTVFSHLFRRSEVTELSPVLLLPSILSLSSVKRTSALPISFCFLSRVQLTSSVTLSPLKPDFCLYEMQWLKQTLLFLLLVFAGSTNADGLNSNSAFPSTNASSLLFLVSVWLMARKHKGMLLLTSSQERALPVFALIFLFYFHFKYFFEETGPFRGNLQVLITTVFQTRWVTMSFFFFF